jgi:hypothetical protein
MLLLCYATVGQFLQPTGGRRLVPPLVPKLLDSPIRVAATWRGQWRATGWELAGRAAIPESNGVNSSGETA